MTREDARQRYEEDGYVVFRDVLGPEWVTAANDHVDSLLEQHPDLRPDQLGHRLARRDPFWHRLVTHEALVDLAQAFLGPDVAVFATHYICKEPHHGRRVLWHQDAGFWPLDPPVAITAWLALTDSTPDNGCLRVVPGSHRGRLVDMVDATQDAVLASELSIAVDEDDAVDVLLRPGDVSVHHPLLFHASDPNTSETWRRGLTIRYIPTSVRIIDPDAASPFLARGAAVPGVNNYLPPPRHDPDRDVPGPIT